MSEHAAERIAGLQGAAAADACVASLQASVDAIAPRTDSIDLGSGFGCTASINRNGSTLGLLSASEDLILRAAGSSDLSQRLLEWRSQETRQSCDGTVAADGRDWWTMNTSSSRRALACICKCQGALLDRLSTLMGVHAERVNLNAAPVELLAILPGLDAERAALIIRSRELGRVMKDERDLLRETFNGISPRELSALREISVIDDRSYVVGVEGWSESRRPAAQRLLLAQAPTGATILQRIVLP